MKAWRIDHVGGIEAIRLCELDAPVLADGEVLIDVQACGINFSDLLMVSGRYQIRPDPPFIPGQEIAGRIAAISAVSKRHMGERVATKVMWGGFASQTAAREDMLVPLPDAMSYPAGWTLGKWESHKRADPKRVEAAARASIAISLRPKLRRRCTSRPALVSHMKRTAAVEGGVPHG